MLEIADMDSIISSNVEAFGDGGDERGLRTIRLMTMVVLMNLRRTMKWDSNRIDRSII